MTSYSEWTQRVGDQWVAALKRAEDAATAATKNVQDASAKIDLPEIPGSDQVKGFQESVQANLPKPSEVVQANFELSSRILEAQREFAMKLVSLADSDADDDSDTSKPAAKKTSSTTRK